MMELFLPFRCIPYNSKVVLYGAGAIGRQYYSQNIAIHWCNIEYALDRNYRQIDDFPVKVLAPEEIQSIDYDYIIISLMFFSLDEDEEVEKIKKLLIGYGVLRERIIFHPSFSLWEADMPRMLHATSGETDKRSLRVAFFPIGSLGNLVIYVKLYQALAGLMKHGTIDIHVVKKRLEIAEAIYNKQNKLGKIIPVDRLDGSDINDQYDLVLRGEYEPIVLQA